MGYVLGLVVVVDLFWRKIKDQRVHVRERGDGIKISSSRLPPFPTGALRSCSPGRTQTMRNIRSDHVPHDDGNIALQAKVLASGLLLLSPQWESLLAKWGSSSPLAG